MHEGITSKDYYNFSPSAQERAHVYIGDRMNAGEREVASMMAESFQKIDKPIANTAVLIPVAAHQDGDLIFSTMEQYSKQRANEPFTIFIHLNAPIDTAPMGAVDFAADETLRAIKAFPGLDIRHDVMYYSDTKIGGIRRNLWNAAFILAHHEGRLSPDVIGMNHDIDTQFISPHYVARVQEHYSRQRSRAAQVNVADYVAKPVLTRVTHAPLDSHPNIAKVTTWIDNTYFQDPDKVGYEAGIVIPFSHYANRGGFRAYSKTHETSWIYDSFSNTTTSYLAGAQLYTSPRRYIDRIDEFGRDKMWEPGSFSDTDACREELQDDISPERAEEIIADTIVADIMHHWLPGAMRKVYSDMETESLLHKLEASRRTDYTRLGTEVVSKQLAKIDRMLRHVIKSNLLADLVAEQFDGNEYASRQVESMANWHESQSDRNIINITLTEDNATAKN